jgi:predicted aconitase
VADKNRPGQFLVNIKARLKEESDYDALGIHVGRIVKDKVPVFKNMDRNVSMQSIIQLGAALATSGTVSLFHAFDITPNRYVHAIITDRGIARPPFRESLSGLAK